MRKESKSERFKRIASKRTDDILDKLRLLGNCANKNSYEYTDAEVNKIFSEIDKQIKVAKLKFSGDKKERFRL